MTDRLEEIEENLKTGEYVYWTNDGDDRPGSEDVAYLVAEVKRLRRALGEANMQIEELGSIPVSPGEGE